MSKIVDVVMTTKGLVIIYALGEEGLEDFARVAIKFT